MEKPLFIIICILAIVFGITIAYRQNKKHKRRISKYLRAKGATKISISTVLVDFDKYKSTYVVKYSDARENRHRTICKIQSGFLSFVREGEMSWNPHPKF